MASSEARRALEGVGEVEWASLHHPYGSAADVPGHLRGLLTDPDSDDALEAASFFAASFVCQGIHYGDAAPHALPFMLRLIAAPGVSGRGDLMSSVLTMLRISVNDGNREVSPELKREWLAAAARHPDAILAIAQRLGGHGFDGAIEALVIAFADAIAPLASRAPAKVRALLAATDTHATPGDRLVAWAQRSNSTVFDWLVEVSAQVPEQYLPADDDDDDDDE